jgi:DNA polymerase III delta subunit
MLFFLHGTDSYRLRQATQVLLDRYCPDRQHGEVYDIDCTEPGASERLERPLKYPSFFGEQRVIIARNALAPALQAVMERYDIPALTDSIVIAIHDASLADTASLNPKMAAVLKKAADETVVCEPLRGQAVAAWIREYCTTRGVMIEPGAVALIVGRVGTESWILANELEKLCAWTENGAIDADAIRLLIAERRERDPWGLSNALAVRDKRGAVAGLWRALHEGVAEQQLAGMLASSFRNLLSIKDLQQRGLSGSAITAKTGIHPFVVTKIQRGAAAYDGDTLVKAHRRLARLDREGKQGRSDSADGLFEIVLSL